MRGTGQGLIVIACLLVAAPPAAAQLPPLLPTPPSPPPAPAPPPATPPLPTYTGTVTSDGVNPAQTNYVDDPSLTTPLTQRWTRRIRPSIERVISGQGLLYVQTESRIVALEPRFGRQVWASPTRGYGPLAYGAGVLVSREGSFLRGRTARTGAVRWQTEIGADVTAPAPIPVGDKVIIGGYRAVTAYDLATGARRWTARTVDDEHDATRPASDGSRVYGVQGCEPYALDAATGNQIWGARPSCTIGDDAPAVYRGRLYTRRNSRLVDGGTGRLLGSYLGGHPILTGDIGVFAVGAGLTAKNLADGRTLWAKRVDVQERDNSPVGVGNTIYGTNGTYVTALALDTGVREQRIKLPGSASGTTTLTVAPGVLVATHRDRIVAYESQYQPAANGVTAGTAVADLELGQRSVVDGIVGSALRPARPKADVMSDTVPFGRYRHALTVPSDGGGYFSVSARPQRNTRLRVHVGGARSNVVRLYVYPRFRSKLRRARRNPNRIRASVTVAAPRGVRLRRRRVVLYIGRMAKRRFDRLGSARLRSAGNGRGRGTVRFNAIRGVRRKDFLYFCIRRSSKLGLGRADVVDRRCGARRLPLR